MVWQNAYSWQLFVELDNILFAENWSQAGQL